MMVGGSVWELKIDPKRLREEIKKRHRKKKKEKNKKIPSRATKMLWDQTVPKILEALGAPENPHETPRELKNAQNEAERHPKRFQNHLWIKSDDFSKIKLPPS